MSCTYNSGTFVLTCSYATWNTPVLDSDYAGSAGEVTVSSVNGQIPSNAFSGLYNTGSYAGDPQINLDCGFGNNNEIQLLSDSFSSNLGWVTQMLITDCNNMVINDGAFAYMTGMTLLTFFAGSFTSISSSAFTGMTSLTTLYIYGTMPATGVPSGLFSGLTSLTTLDMSRTNIVSLPAGIFSDLKNLNELNLEDSSLVTLPGDLFHPLLSVTLLNINTNSWTCDCQLEWLSDWLTYKGITTDATCASPSGLSGYNVTEALKSLTCTTSESSSDGWDDWVVYALAAGVIVSLILLGLVFAGCIYLRNELGNMRSKLEDDVKKVKTEHDSKKQSKSQVWAVKQDTLAPASTSSPSTARKGKVVPTQLSVTNASYSMNSDWAK